MIKIKNIHQKQKLYRDLKLNKSPKSNFNRQALEQKVCEGHVECIYQNYVSKD